MYYPIKIKVKVFKVFMPTNYERGYKTLGPFEFIVNCLLHPSNNMINARHFEGSKPAGAYPYGCVNRWVNTWKQPFVQKPVLFLTAPPTPNIDKSESKIINIIK